MSKQELSQKEMQKIANNKAKEQSDVVEFMQILHERNINITNKLIGKVLTIIDAVTVKEEQRKAIKDLVHQAFAAHKTNTNKLEAEIVNTVSALKYGLEGIQQKDFPGWDCEPLFPIEAEARQNNRATQRNE